MPNAWQSSVEQNYKSYISTQLAVQLNRILLVHFSCVAVHRRIEVKHIRKEYPTKLPVSELFFAMLVGLASGDSVKSA